MLVHHYFVLPGWYLAWKGRTVCQHILGSNEIGYIYLAKLFEESFDAVDVVVVVVAVGVIGGSVGDHLSLTVSLSPEHGVGRGVGERRLETVQNI